MTHQDFCYWLQGVFEVADLKTLDEKQVALVREHLQLVFTKVTSPALAPMSVTGLTIEKLVTNPGTSCAAQTRAARTYC